MGTVKKLNVAPEGLSGFVVTYSFPNSQTDTMDGTVMHFWAEDIGHAGEQMEDADPDATIDLIETAAQYEARTGEFIYEGEG